MSVIGTVKAILGASVSSLNRAGGSTESSGAYWCHDCAERVLDRDVQGDEPPTCPNCAEPMAFERSVGSSGCAC